MGYSSDILRSEIVVGIKLSTEQFRLLFDAILNANLSYFTQEQLKTYFLTNECAVGAHYFRTAFESTNIYEEYCLSSVEKMEEKIIRTAVSHVVVGIPLNFGAEADSSGRSFMSSSHTNFTDFMTKSQTAKEQLIATLGCEYEDAIEMITICFPGTYCED